MSATGSTRRRTIVAAVALTLACQRAPKTNIPPAVTGDSTATSPCVDFHDLSVYLPREVAGFGLARDEGSTGKYGEVSVSEAERVFAADAGREITVRIVDTTLTRSLGQAILAAVKEADARPSSDPTAPIHLDDAVGFVRYDPAALKAEANLLVGDRYVVAVATQGFEGTVEVRRLTRTLDLAGLSKLR